jgi:hypothetical protein
LEEYVKDPTSGRKSYVGEVDYTSIDSLLDAQIGTLQILLENTDMEIVEKKLDEDELNKGQEQIKEIENMYKSVTSLVLGIEKSIKQTAHTQNVSDELKALIKEKSNYKLADDIVSIFKKVNSTDDSLELMHDLTKDTLN